MLTRAALAAIVAYQRWISPYKGFSCAYRVMHGGPGCSGYAKAVLQEHGPLAAPSLMKQRFAACKAAATALAANRADEDPKRGRAASPRKKRNERLCNAADFCVACAPAGCGSAAGASGSDSGGPLSGCSVPDCAAGCDAGSCRPDCSFGCCGN